MSKDSNFWKSEVNLDDVKERIRQRALRFKLADYSEINKTRLHAYHVRKNVILSLCATAIFAAVYAGFSAFMPKWLLGIFTVSVFFLLLAGSLRILRIRAEAVDKELNQAVGELKNANEDLEKSLNLADRADIAKARFLANMSHELRTPINAILGMNEMVVKESSESSIREYAVNIRSAGRTLLTLVNDVIESAKIESGDIELNITEYDLGELLYDMININKLKANEKGLAFYLDLDENMPGRLFGDEFKIKTVLLNIISNAIKYTDNGAITLSVFATPAEDESVMLNVSVRDTGRGIRQEDIEKLCTPFERIDEELNHNIEGTGLGMAITNQLLLLMDSNLQIESKYGKGSLVSFSIKQKVADLAKIGNVEDYYETTKRDNAKIHHGFKAPGAKVLVVDDAPINLMIFEGLLKDSQMKIEKASSGFEAIEICKKERFNAIFIDHMMPEMDGIDTLHRIKKDEESLNKRIPAIILTANAVQGVKNKYLREGFDEYLPKPIDTDQLEEMLVRFLPEDLVDLSTAVETENAESTNIETEEKQESSVILDDKIKAIGEVEDIDIEMGLKFSGGPELYISVVEKFAETGLSRADVIEQYYEQQDIENYTIQVHALKSSARVVGDGKLSKLAEELEMAGKSNDTSLIEAHTEELLSMYRKLTTKLTDLLGGDDDLELIDSDSLKDAVTSIIEVVEGFDFDSADAIMNQLKKYRMPEEFKDTYSKLKILMAEVSRDEIIELLKEYIGS